MDDASGLLFSHSVPDLFAFLHTVGDAFWQHARSLHGYGVAASLPLLVDLLNNTLQQYSAHVLHTAGMDVLPHIYPTTDVKLKQAKAEPTDKVNIQHSGTHLRWRCTRPSLRLSPLFVRRVDPLFFFFFFFFFFLFFFPLVGQGEGVREGPVQEGQTSRPAGRRCAAC